MNVEQEIRRLGESERAFVSIWLVGALVAVALLGMAMLYGISWGWALLAFIVSTTGKWLGRAANRKKSLLAYEQEMLKRGFSPQQAHEAWEQAYYGGQDKLAELRAVEREQQARTDSPQARPRH